MNKHLALFVFTLWYGVAMPQVFHQPEPFRFFVGTEARLAIMGDATYIMHGKNVEARIPMESNNRPYLCFGLEWKIHKRWSLLFRQNFNVVSMMPSRFVNPTYLKKHLYVTKDYIFAVRYRYYVHNNKAFSMDWGWGKLDKGLYFYSVNRDNEIYKTDFKVRMWNFQNTFHIDRLSVGIGYYFSFNPSAYYAVREFRGILYAHIKYDIFRY